MLPILWLLYFIYLEEVHELFECDVALYLEPVPQCELVLVVLKTNDEYKHYNMVTTIGSSRSRSNVGI